MIAHFFLAVLAAFLKFLAVGLPFAPACFIVSPDPPFILALLACMLAYNPVLFGIINSYLDFLVFLVFFCFFRAAIASLARLSDIGALIAGRGFFLGGLPTVLPYVPAPDGITIS